MEIDLNISISGQAGQGMNVISATLGKLFVRSGYWVFTSHDLMSRIRGGNNTSQIRVSSRAVYAPSADADILVCLDKNSLLLNKDKKNRAVVCDSAMLTDGEKISDALLPLPLEQIAKETGGDARMANTVASGAVLALLDMPLDGFNSLIDQSFAGKAPKVAEDNRKCAEQGYQYMRAHYQGKLIASLKGNGSEMPKMILSGSEAVALGALSAGLRFYSAYPMSPSTGVMEFLAARQQECGIIVEQAEDEIAAINMALGASFAGARSMTGTSGGGLALMVEGISLAGMIETPLVILDGQRPAPATGLPTRTEQGDLLFVAHAGHGDFPKAILAPSSAENAVSLTRRAFSLAEKYQIPVFLLADQYLLDSSWSAPAISLEQHAIDRESFVAPEHLKNVGSYGYKRYQLTENGVSPMLVPGTPAQVVYADSDEHTEEGHITESAKVRVAMVQKRLRKAQALRKEITPPLIFPGTEEEVYVISWGSTLGLVREAVELLRVKGRKIGSIHFTDVFPLNEDCLPPHIIKNARLIAVEQNAAGQFAQLLKAETGIAVKDMILKYDGRPFTPGYLLNEIEGCMRK